ncbi:ABC transporter permease [Paracoccus sp. 1_MG-2023]|uniref:PhnE/PtxC family ABC transporter permease n=1 Tax=unclassified Paracoccus (in: a-proteobacteria) TaxID=2688777 RepID=UPI001C09EC1E|nr:MULTISPECIES: ABC transporter permease [unclassified Paracoccus (in: a-proteobacteria)]MBU2957755.1 ABC transporter permease [Paracoccus sp. C2R09]MDO6667397.1 ABC transporter permease [Paracoccus sp. 1_MG-2023]
MPARISRLSVVAGFAALAAILLPFADLTVAGHDPWAALSRMARGFLSPDFGGIEQILWAVALTVGFAIAGVALGGVTGLLMSPFYGMRPVRWTAIALRSVHELFWALLLLQVLGIGAWTGVLAIALPYAGIFAKVMSEILDEADRRPSDWLGPKVDPLSRFLWARVPLARAEMASYALYRLECGLRSSAVLGFVGLPTLGFQLDTFFRQGHYGAAGAVMIIYIALIGTVRWWMRPRLLIFWIAAAMVLLTRIDAPPMGQGAFWRFLTSDIVPAPLRQGVPAGLWPWLWDMLTGAILPGLAATMIVAQIALVLTGIVAFAGQALVIPRVAGRIGAWIGNLILVVLRSFPEYMLAFLFLQIWGPSMLPAILALALHNGAIIAHLLGRQAQGLTLRADAPRGLTLWGWEIAPRLFGSFVALCLYRWEIIIRESAIMGILGIATLGFYLDDAIAELRMDRAVVILIATALVTVLIDRTSRSLRARLGAGRLTVGEAPSRTAANC